jgi:hypothetical protein
MIYKEKHSKQLAIAMMASLLPQTQTPPVE